MSSDELFQVLTVIVAENAGVDEDGLTEATRFEALDIDSLEFVDMLLAVENQLGVKIPDEAIPQLGTIGDLHRYVSGKLAESLAPTA